MNIRQILAQEGIQWAGRMDCPRCKVEKKITASESKGIAKCWKCNATWTEKGTGGESTWANALIRGLADRCQEYLEHSIPAITWLVDKRGLPEDIAWLRAHNLGAVPKNINAAALSAEALDHLNAERQEAVDACETEKQALKVELRYDQEEKRLQKFTEILIKLDDKTWTDAVVYIYNDAHGNPISLNVRQQKLETGDGEKHCMRIQPRIGQRGLFCPVETSGEAWDGKLPTIIVEGEHNWLTLLRRADEWGVGYELAGFAMGGKNGADRNAAKQLLAREKPMVIYDNDTLSDSTNRPGGWDLVEALSWRFSLDAATTPVKDADDWVKSTTVMPHHLLELAKNAEFVPRPYEAVAEEITNIRNEKMLAFMKDKLITELIWEDVLDKALVYNAGDEIKPAQGILMMLEKDKSRTFVEVAKDHPTISTLLRKYGVEPGDDLSAKLGANLWSRTVDAERAPLRVLSHYVQNTGSLYLDRGDGTVLVLQPSRTPKVIANGEDSVVFTPHKTGPSQVMPNAKKGVGLNRKGGLFDELITSGVLWDEEFGLDAGEQKLLLRVHVLQLFFDDTLRMKMSPMYEGPGGSEKNTITERVGRLLEGADFAVQHMPRTTKALSDLSVNKLYVGFDEFDSQDHEMESGFRWWATALYREERRLYTNFQTARAPLARGASFSTNYNPMKEATTSRRVLPFFVKARTGDYKSPAQELWRQFDAAKTALWEEILADLQVIVDGLWDVPQASTKCTMADVGVFIHRCAQYEGWYKESLRLVDRLNDAQMAVIGKKSFWVQMMVELLRSRPELQGKEMTAKEWCNAMKPLIDFGDHDSLERLNSRKFATFCNKGGKQLMERYCSLCKVTAEGKNVDSYSFSLPDEFA
jgi:hypothetical protein